MEYLQYYPGCIYAYSERIVLNLIINGIPSILCIDIYPTTPIFCFKPYYKWNTFNTVKTNFEEVAKKGFKPYYKWNTFNTAMKDLRDVMVSCFKPYYKWNTFNTLFIFNTTIIVNEF